jgi:hypothetical protein
VTRTGRIVLAAWLVAGGLAVPRLLAAPAAPADCPPGYERIDPDRPEPTALRGLRTAEARIPQTGCVSVKRPEGFAELALRSAQQAARTADRKSVV